MKKILIVLLTLAFGVSKTKAQELENKNTFKINPLSLFLRTGSVFYERKLNDNSSLQIGVAYSGLKFDEVGYNGLVITPEYRLYTRNKAIDGFYFAPYLRYQNFNVKSGEDKGRLSTLGGGVLLGRQWIFTKGFALDIFIGPSYSSGSYKITVGTEPDFKGGVEGLGIRTGIAIGLGF